MRTHHFSTYAEMRSVEDAILLSLYLSANDSEWLAITDGSRTVYVEGEIEVDEAYLEDVCNGDLDEYVEEELEDIFQHWTELVDSLAA